MGTIILIFFCITIDYYGMIMMISWDFLGIKPSAKGNNGMYL